MDFMKLVLAPALGAFFNALIQNKSVLARLAVRRLDGALYLAFAMDASPVVQKQVFLVLGVLVTTAVEGLYALARKRGWAT